MDKITRRLLMDGGGGGDVPVVDTSYVDLGLPSGLLWASGNLVKDSSGNYSIGAETDWGTYVSWGNIIGHNEGEGYDFRAANYTSTPGNSVAANIPSNDAAHDIALATLGTPWHLPTKEDYQELYDNTDSEWVADYNGTGVAGRKFMKKSDHSVYVFFPASGHYSSNSLFGRGTYGRYCSSSFYNSTNAYNLYFDSSSVLPQNSDCRFLGLAVRPVTLTPPQKVTLKVKTTDGTTKEGVELTVTNSGTSTTVTTDSKGTATLSGLSGPCTITSDTHDLDVSQFEASGTMTVNIRATKKAILYAYITIDQTKSDETQMITVRETPEGQVQTLNPSTGVHANAALQALRSSSHLYLGKKTAEGKMTICQLKDDDGTKYLDGTTANMDGTEGDHWMRIGTPFYFKRTSGVDSGDVVTYGIVVGGKPDSTWKQIISPNDLLGVHEAIASDTGDNTTGVLYSKSGTDSTGNISQANFKQKARNKGTGFTLVTWEWHCVMAMLFYGWYGRTNAQAQCGTGANSNSGATRYTGLKDSYGMTDTTSSDGNTDNIKFWGIENWWGCKYEFIDNVVVDARVWKVTDKEGTQRTAGTGASSDGEIQKMLLSENLDLVPKNVVTNFDYNTYFCDLYTQTAKNSRGVMRSSINSDGNGGITCVDATTDSSSTYAFSGSRLAFNGEIEIAQNRLDYLYPSVDLGLPSGKLWCANNIGASVPEGYGDYFSWGNVDGHAEGSGYNFDQTTYNATMGASLTGDIPRNATYDAAVANCGGHWHMPSKDDFQELYDECTWTWTTVNGVNGYNVVSKSNGNSIFLAASGYYIGTSLNRRGTSGFYWSSSFISATSACGLYFISSSVNPQNGDSRRYGLTVRPISDGNTITFTVTTSDSTPVDGIEITVSNAGRKEKITFDSTGTATLDIAGDCTISSVYHELSVTEFTADTDKTVAIVATKKTEITGFIILDQTQTDPALKVVDESGNTYSGFERPAVIDLIRENSHRFVGIYDSTNSVMALKELDDSDSRYYADGTSASTDITTNGKDVFMRLPIFFTKATETETDKWKIEFCYDPTQTVTEKTGWKKWGGNDLIGAYEAYETSNMTYSKSGVDSTGSVSQANMKAHARARGTGFSLVKWRHQNIMAILFYAYYGHTNCQTICGSGYNGNSGSSRYTGLKNSLGMSDTTSANGNTDNIVFWGLENWWGCKYEWVDNVVVNSGTWVITEDDGTTRTPTGTMAAAGSLVYPSKFVLNDDLDVIGASGQTGGSDSTGYCDCQYIANQSSRVVLRSYDSAGASGGVAYVNASSVSSDTSSRSGSRLAYSGNISLATYERIKLVFTTTDESSVQGIKVSVTDSYSGTYSATTDSNGVCYVYAWTGAATITSSNYDLGTSSITVSEGAVISITATEKIQWVDLGLPSGLLWATGNLVKDASGNYGIGEETDYGTYVSWANVVGHNEGEGYDFSSTNYNSTTGASQSTDIASDDSSHDIALNRLGAPWRLPTKTEYQELYDNTDSEGTTINGVAGRKFMKKSDHSVYVFFPITGFYNGTTHTSLSAGFYWSSSWKNSLSSYYLHVESSSVYPQNDNYRRYGYTVRPVKPSSI